MATARPGRRHLRIGELERLLGVTRDQVHHYVELGLVPPPEKSAATLAWYGPEHQAAIVRVRAIRDAGGSLAQAHRWLTGSLAHAGPADCATLTRWVVDAAARAGVRPSLDAVVAMIDAGLARVEPDALVAGATIDRAAWMEELAARWPEREEHARVVVAREAMDAAATAAFATWWSIDAARVRGGVMRASALDQSDGAADEERARLAVILPAGAPIVSGRWSADGTWSACGQATAAIRAKRWGDAQTALARAPESTLATALAWCVGAVAAVKSGDGVLARVAGVGALRAIEASSVGELVERLRLRWTLAVTWLALPPRWAGERYLTELGALLEELATVASDDRRRATGELDVIEANAWLALCAARLRDGDRAGAAEAAKRAAVFGGAAATEAARLGRRASKAL